MSSPPSFPGEVARVLSSKDLYEVLEVSRDADDEAVRRAKRLKSLATHPDKLGGAVGAKEAFQRVTEVKPWRGCGGRHWVWGRSQGGLPKGHRGVKLLGVEGWVGRGTGVAGAEGWTVQTFWVGAERGADRGVQQWACEL